MPSASLERGVRGRSSQVRSPNGEGGERGESTSKCLCMNEGFVLALPRMISKAIEIISFSCPSPMGRVCLTADFTSGLRFNGT